MRIRKALAASLATIAVSATMAVAPAASAVDSPLGSGPVCDAEAIQLCLSANGTTGNYVYTKYYDSDNEEDTTVGAANVCAGADVVVDGSSPCPFADHSGMNSAYVGDLIVTLRNNRENGVWYEGDPNVVLQQSSAGAGSGYLWVLAPAGNNYYYIINVLASNGGNQYHLCSIADDSWVVLQSSWGGAGSCEYTNTGAG